MTTPEPPQPKPTPLPPTPVLETPRLILRPVALDDVAAIERRFAKWEIVRYLNPRVTWPMPEGDVEKHVRLSLDETARREKFHRTITLKGGDDEAIGRIDLWPDDGKSRDMRGFWISGEFHGRGLMTEAAERVTEYAFLELGWPHLWLSNAEANGASHRVKEKQGAVIVGREPASYVYGPGTRIVWLLKREDWLARR